MLPADTLSSVAREHQRELMRAAAQHRLVTFAPWRARVEALLRRRTGRPDTRAEPAHLAV